MKKENKIIQQILDRINDELEKCPKYILEFGVFEGSSKDLRNKERRKGKVRTRLNTESGLTNGQIMFIMEQGSLTRNIPARPILELTRKYALENLIPKAEQELITIWLTEGKSGKKKIQEIVDKLAMRIEAYVKTNVRRKNFDIAPNALSTIEKKGSDIPLLDTGQLVNSIQCRARRIN